MAAASYTALLLYLSRLATRAVSACASGWSRCLCGLALAALAAAPLPLFAVSFSEIMYDVPGSDEKREWVEMHNRGTEAVDISGWRFVEGGVHHKLVPHGTSSIPAGAYALIVENADAFFADYPGFSGIVFDSSFSLSNEGETLLLRDSSGTDIASVSYAASMGAKGDGTSLQLIGGSWLASVPTLGAENVISKTPAIPPPAAREDTAEYAPPAASEPLAEAQGTGQFAAVSAAAPARDTALVWWLLVGLSALAIGGVTAYLARGEEKGAAGLSAKDFAMIDISDTS
jgi:hypothetical protein